MAVRKIDVALWLHDRECVSGCEGTDRKEHAKTQMPSVRKYTSVSSAEELASLMHEEMCAVWVQRMHGGALADRAKSVCGADGERHTGMLVESAMFKELADILGVGAG
ncbi:hypothetical protein DIMARIA_83 [Mycobacterium phage DiMaria]